MIDCEIIEFQLTFVQSFSDTPWNDPQTFMMTIQEPWFRHLIWPFHLVPTGGPNKPSAKKRNQPDIHCWRMCKGMEGKIIGNDLTSLQTLMLNVKISIHHNIWVFPKIGIPQNGWFIMENPIKMDDLGIPPILETPIYYYNYNIYSWFVIYIHAAKKNG